MATSYSTIIRPEWIDYNGHMQDAFYGLIFSYAVDGFQDAVGFDAHYRASTDCTIYLLEDHKFFLREVKEGDEVKVETRLLGYDHKRFHLHQTMFEQEEPVAVSEAVELHVRKHPKPQSAVIPDDILERLQSHLVDPSETARLHYRSRALLLKR